MTKIYTTLACISGLSLICALMMNDPTYIEAKSLCFEQCTQEIGGRCLGWQRQCLSDDYSKSLTGMGASAFQTPVRQSFAKIDI